MHPAVTTITVIKAITVITALTHVARRIFGWHHPLQTRRRLKPRRRAFYDRKERSDYFDAVRNVRLANRTQRVQK